MKPIFCAVILVAGNCSGAQTKTELKFDKVELEELGCREMDLNMTDNESIGSVVSEQIKVYS